MLLWGKAPVVLARKTIALVQLPDELKLCDLGLSHHIGQDSAQTAFLQKAAGVKLKAFPSCQHKSANSRVSDGIHTCVPVLYSSFCRGWLPELGVVVCLAFLVIIAICV